MPPGFGPILGLKIGHAQDAGALTGCTVFLAEGGMTAGCDVRGSASGTRELAALDCTHIAPKIHGLVLAGGSAYGLDAAAGVMRWLEGRGAGFDAGVARVPIVPAAILFDLALGDSSRRPDAAMGYQAAEAARKSPVAEGNVGAGTGASVGKLGGIARAMKAGIGCWTEPCAGMEGGAVQVAALAAVNAFGDVRDPATGRLLAGARTAADSRELLDTAAALRRGMAPPSFGRAAAPPHNTVLAVVATDAALSRAEAGRLAVMASAGMARALSPAWTCFDGDVVFALSCGSADVASGGATPSSRRADLNALGAAAAEAVAAAIVRGVTQAHSAGGLPGLAG